MEFEHTKDARRIVPASNDLVQRNGHPLPLLWDSLRNDQRQVPMVLIAVLTLTITWQSQDRRRSCGLNDTACRAEEPDTDCPIPSGENG